MCDDPCAGGDGPAKQSEGLCSVLHDGGGWVDCCVGDAVYLVAAGRGEGGAHVEGGVGYDEEYVCGCGCSCRCF